MGTSAILYLYKDGECKLAALSNYDGYASGVGVEVFGFVSNKHNLSRLCECLPKCKFITREQVLEFRSINRDWEEKYIETHPEYTIEGGSRLLNMIISRNGNVSMIFWSGDRRSDDWGYVIDVDKMTFEVYKGLNDVPPEKNERFYDGLPPSEHEFQPLKELAVFDLNNLPSNDEFLSIVRSAEELNRKRAKELKSN